jgi:hypothetical protein
MDDSRDKSSRGHGRSLNIEIPMRLAYFALNIDRWRYSGAMSYVTGRFRIFWLGRSGEGKVLAGFGKTHCACNVR